VLCTRLRTLLTFSGFEAMYSFTDVKRVLATRKYALIASPITTDLQLLMRR